MTTVGRAHTGREQRGASCSLLLRRNKRTICGGRGQRCLQIGASHRGAWSGRIPSCGLHRARTGMVTVGASVRAMETQQQSPDPTLNQQTGLGKPNEIQNAPKVAAEESRQAKLQGGQPPEQQYLLCLAAPPCVAACRPVLPARDPSPSSLKLRPRAHPPS